MSVTLYRLKYSWEFVTNLTVRLASPLKILAKVVKPNARLRQERACHLMPVSKLTKRRSWTVENFRSTKAARSNASRHFRFMDKTELTFTRGCRLVIEEADLSDISTGDCKLIKEYVVMRG